MPEYKVRGWVRYQAIVETEVTMKAGSPEEARRKATAEGLLEASVSREEIALLAEVEDAEVLSVKPADQEKEVPA